MNGNLLNPDTPPVGRQPSSYKVTPSKAGNPWYGSIVDGTREHLGVTGGRRFTIEQERALIGMGMDPLMVPVLVVKRQAMPEELSWPFLQLPPVYAFECPVIGKTVDRIRVIAPSGAKKLVLDSGWIHHPYRDPFKLQVKIRGGVL